MQTDKLFKWNWEVEIQLVNPILSFYKKTYKNGFDEHIILINLVDK